MISPESLRRYPFFGGLTHAQLVSIAIIATQETYPAGVTLFQKGLTADTLYFLEEGGIDLYYPTKGKKPLKFPEEILVSEVNPGEPFSISALIEPFILTSTSRTAKPSRIIQIEAKPLRALFRTDKRLAYLLTQQATKAVIERLDATRVQLAAAWA
jgi:CRP-like cAMP-binding protein